MSILEELYYGNIRPWENYIKKGSEYHKLNNRLTEDIDKLVRSLNKEEKKLFNRIENTAIALSSISERERYTDGFCTGAKMILEIMNYKSKNYI